MARNAHHFAAGLVLALGLATAAHAQNQALSVTTSPPGGYVELPASPKLAPPHFTLETWFTYNDATLPTGWVYPTIGRKNFTQGVAEWFLRVDAGNSGARVLRLWIGGTSGVVNVSWPFAAGAFLNWTHVAATYDGSFARLYINGNQVAQATGTGPLLDLGSVARIGAGDTAPGSAQERWNGLLDEVRIWSTARTQPEIAAGMFQQILAAPNLSASYQLNGNGLDASGNGLHGTLVGSPTFVTVPSPAGPNAYCTAGTTTNGCLPSIASNGYASASATSGFTIAISAVEGSQSGLIFYGVSGGVAFPWGLSSSFMCVKSPLERTPVQNSGGTLGACDGVLSLDWNAYISTHPSALGNPFVGGETVFAQGWFRDPPSTKTTNLSNGLEFDVQP